MASVTEVELLKALQDALEQAGNEHADGAMTVSELADELGWYRNKVLRFLKSLKAQGKLEVIKVHREALDGSQRVSPAYRFKMEDA